MKKGFTLKRKKILNLTIFVMGIIMVSVVGTKAATTIASNMITYNNTTVKETLDDLVDVTLQGTATSSDITLGKTALVQGKLVTGTLENTSWPDQYEIIRNKQLIDTTLSYWHYDKLRYPYYDTWKAEITNNGYHLALSHASDEANVEMVFISSDITLKKNKYTNCILKFGNVAKSATFSVYGDGVLLKSFTPTSNSTYTIPIGDDVRISFRVSVTSVCCTTLYDMYITDYYFE